MGTAFNISLSESQVTVTLTEGIVDSGTDSERIRMAVGQELQFRNGRADVQIGSARYWPAWKRGLSVLKTCPLVSWLHCLTGIILQ
ncbi:hypothetical protein [Aliamphritea spongicola]|nr:hypothetical protein [Aliamphritea spongicola]